MPAGEGKEQAGRAKKIISKVIARVILSNHWIAIASRAGAPGIFARIQSIGSCGKVGNYKTNAVELSLNVFGCPKTG
jgi:hypothetical protein